MMNLRKKSKKTILSSLIALALSSNMAFAMPQGGTVVAGNVNGVTNGSLKDLVSGGTLNVTGNSLLDWKSFSIGQNETLNVLFGSGANMLINHVTGSEISQLLGALNAYKGDGAIMLINPNGIVVGPQAQLNVGSLIMSSMNIDDDQLKNVLAVMDKEEGTVPLVWTKGGKIEIQKGAVFNIKDTLELYGGKIQIADGVTISNGLKTSIYDRLGNEVKSENNSDADAIMIAADSLKQDLQHSGDPGEKEIVATADNSISIGKADIVNKGGGFHQSIIGGTVTLNGTKVGTTSNPVTGLDVMAISKHENHFKESYGHRYIEDFDSKADVVNRVTIKDAEINVEPAIKRDFGGYSATYGGLGINGGQIIIENSKLTGSPLGIKLRAYTEVNGGFDKDAIKINSAKITPENVVAIRNSELASDSSSIENVSGETEIMGGKVLLDGITVKMNETQGSIYALKDITDDGEHIKTNADVENLVMIRNAKAVITGDGHGENKIEPGTLYITGGQVKIDKSEAETNVLEISAINTADDVDNEFGGSDDRVLRAGKDNELIIQDSSAKAGANVLLAGGSVFLLGDTRVELGKDKSFIVAAGNEIDLKYVEFGDKTKEILGDNLVKADGTVELSQKTIGNQTALGIFPQETKFQTVSNEKRNDSFVELDKFFASLKENNSSEAKQVQNNVKTVVQDNTLTTAQKVEKVKEVIANNEVAAKVMDSVRGQVDSNNKVASVNNTSIPTTTNTESANVSTSEGEMSANEIAVKGVDEKKK